MTTAPPNLLAVRALLLAYLNPAPVRRAADLEPDEVGIVGDTAHVDSGDSYHLGLPDQRKTGYSVTESPRDAAGLSPYASALDVGEFTVAGRDLAHFSAWLVAQCKANRPDARDIREVIYSLDGKTVRRWDRLGRRSTGDSSHRWHTHVSFFRDATEAGRDQLPLFRRYLREIGLLPPDPTPRRGFPFHLTIGDDMPHLMIKHTKHNEIFACFPGGAVRHIGPTELAKYQTLLVPLEQTTDEQEYQRLLATAKAIQA